MEASTTAPAAEPKPERKLTEYVILGLVHGANDAANQRETYEVLAATNAPSRAAAIRNVAGDLLADAGENVASVRLCAIPRRSFEPVTVSAEVKRAVKIS